MVTKEVLLKMRNKLTGYKEASGNSSEVQAESQRMSLNSKVDEFIDWYYENHVKGHFTDVGEFSYPREMRNFIEKIAVWYELRYPEYEVNRKMPGSMQEGTNVNDAMFNNNEYFAKSATQNSNMNWDEFYNFDAFVNSLPWDERSLIADKEYKNTIFLSYDSNASLELEKDGTIKKVEELETLTNSIKPEELVGLHAKDALKLFQEKNVSLEDSLAKAVDEDNSYTDLRNRILDCAMYRVIERGGNRIGPRRGFLFAKEFERNIDIPMKYGVDRSDPGLESFINDYLNAGGSKDLECYDGYFHRTRENQKLGKVTVGELITLKNKKDIDDMFDESTNTQSDVKESGNKTL